jgi:hypothetical protein
VHREEEEKRDVFRTFWGDAPSLAISVIAMSTRPTSKIYILYVS